MLADALTKEKADAHDLLRACIRSGVYQLADESVTLESAAAERERRRVRRELSSSHAEGPQPPAEQVSCVVCEMVGVSAVGDPDSVRSLLESLTTVASPYPTIVKCVSSSRKMSVTIPAMVLDSGLTGSTRGIKVTLSYHNSTNYIQ
eukprot:9435217-Pyramimonas_sp.AAC.1